MKDLKLVTVSLVATTLLASNLIVGGQYIHDSRKYESKIHSQYKLIKQMKVNASKGKQQIQNDQSQINNLNAQLEQVKKENDDLKKQLK